MATRNGTSHDEPARTTVAITRLTAGIGRLLRRGPETARARSVLRRATTMALLLPAGWLVWQWVRALLGLPHALGPNPPEWTHRFTGRLALELLLATLATSSLARVFGWRGLLLLRRRLGLLAALYMTLHVGNYIFLDRALDWAEIAGDLTKRPYIVLGATAFAASWPLVLTSTDSAIRRLGGRRWRRLHRLVYLVLAAAIAHSLWQMKTIEPRPVIFAVIAVGLAIERLVARTRRKRRGKEGPRPSCRVA